MRKNLPVFSVEAARDDADHAVATSKLALALSAISLGLSVAALVSRLLQ